MHLTSTISISLVLLLIGLTCLLLLTAHVASNQFRENITFSILLNDEATPEYAKRVERYLLASPYAKSVQYIPKEEALKEIIATLGEDPEKFLGYNPLQASLEVKLNAAYANTDSVAMIESKLKSFDQISRTVFENSMIDLVNNNIKKISVVLLGLTVVLLLISIALINNTIRLTIYSNRFLINTMKLVGANPWFIRKPYIKRSIRNGVIAGVLAIIYLVALLYYLRYQFALETMNFNPIIAATVGLVIILTGIMITGISSYIAVGRYLRMSTNDMYFV